MVAIVSDVFALLKRFLLNVSTKLYTDSFVQNFKLIIMSLVEEEALEREHQAALAHQHAKKVKHAQCKNICEAGVDDEDAEEHPDAVVQYFLLSLFNKLD